MNPSCECALGVITCLPGAIVYKHKERKKHAWASSTTEHIETVRECSSWWLLWVRVHCVEVSLVAEREKCLEHGSTKWRGAGGGAAQSWAGWGRGFG